MPQLPSRTSPTLAAIHARRQRDNWTGRGSTFIPAGEAASECSRAIWYGFRWASEAEAFSGRMLRLFATGNMEERRILDDLAKLPGVQLESRDANGKQFRAEIQGYIAVKPDGFALGLPEAKKTRHAIECKSANDKNFDAIKKKGLARGKSEHWIQCQLEMLAFGVTRVFYFLVNKNTDEEYVERIKPDVIACARAVQRLISIAEAPRPPAKIRDDADKPPCLFCRHKPICHDGAAVRRHCRTCIHVTPKPGGNWRCEWHQIDLTPESQAEGCEHQRFIPELVNGEQIDVRGENVVYRMRDGTEWVDVGT